MAASRRGSDDTGAGTTPASESTAKSAKKVTVWVKTMRPQRFRAGLHFKRGWQSAEVTRDQLDAIDADPYLTVETSKPEEVTETEERQAAEVETNRAIRDKQDKERDKNRKAARAARGAKLDKMAKEAEAEAKRQAKREKG